MLLCNIFTLNLSFHTFNNIHDIIAHLFGFADDIHIEDTALVIVFLLVDAFNVFGTQQVAVVIDFTLLVVAAHKFSISHIFHIFKHDYHIGHCFVNILEHRIYIGIDFICKVSMCFFLAH